MEYDSYDDILWYQADLWDWRSLSFLGRDEFSEITHILYAPAPAGRTHRDYAEIYSFGLGRVLYSLPRNCLDRLQRCVLVGSSAVWGPSDDWVNEDTPVQRAGFRAESLLDAEAVLKALPDRSEEHTSELQSLMRISYAVICLKKKKTK